MEVDIPVLYNHPVGANYEDNFMREVKNLDPQRERRPPQRFDDELYNCTEDMDLTADINEPSNINEAWNGKNSAELKKATESEYKSLIDNHTSELVLPPHDKNIVGSKWVFKVKGNADGTVQKFKARLVAEGYTQSPGIDYDEVFAPVVRYTSIISLLAVAYRVMRNRVVAMRRKSIVQHFDKLCNTRLRNFGTLFVLSCIRENRMEIVISLLKKIIKLLKNNTR